MSALLLPLALTAAPLSGEPAAIADTEQVRAREEQVLGHPPRVAPIEAITDELRELTLPPPGYGTPGEMTMVYRIMLNNPEMVRANKPIGNFFIVEGSLPARDRELMILRVAWLAKSPYEWGEHVKIAKATGVANREIDDIVVGSAAPTWSEHDRALLARCRGTARRCHDLGRQLGCSEEGLRPAPARGSAHADRPVLCDGLLAQRDADSVARGQCRAWRAVMK